MKDSPSAMIIAGPIHAELRSAINIKNALDHIHRLQKLGYCPTKVQQFRDYFELDKRDERDSTPTESDSEETLGTQKEALWIEISPTRFVIL
jgi:hypothetical protein